MNEANLEERLLFFVESIEAIEQQMGFYVGQLRKLKSEGFKVEGERRNYMEPVRRPSLIGRVNAIGKEMLMLYGIRSKLTEKYMRVAEYIYRFEPDIIDKDVFLSAIRDQFTLDNFEDVRENVKVDSDEMLALLMNIQSDRMWSSSSYKGEVDRLKARKKILGVKGDYVVPLRYELVSEYVTNRRQGRALLKGMGFLD